VSTIAEKSISITAMSSRVNGYVSFMLYALKRWMLTVLAESSDRVCVNFTYSGRGRFADAPLTAGLYVNEAGSGAVRLAVEKKFLREATFTSTRRARTSTLPP
jgi:hypothetical protein